MNTYRARGWALYLGGRAEETVGWLTFSRRRRAAGFERRIRGEAMMAIARAQRFLAANTGKTPKREQDKRALSA